MSEPPPLIINPDSAGLGAAAEPDPAAGNLAQHAARGARVTLAAQLMRMALQVGSIVVLARLLRPSDYGLIAAVAVIIGVGEILRDFGLTNAVLQAPTLSRHQQDNLFWINTAIGIVLAAILFLGAGMVADIFGHPALVGIARVMSVMFLLNGMATQWRADLMRRLQFGRLVSADILGQVAAVIVSITAAAAGAGYWALVAQQLTQLTVALVFVCWFAHWLPRGPHRDASVRSITRIGVNLAATELVYYLSSNLDTLTIGLRFSATSLGLYNRGFQLLMTPLNQLRSPATTVALPILSRLQDDYDRAGEYLRRGQLTLGYTIVPALAVTAGAAAPVVALLLGPRWTQTVPVLTLLAIAGACQTLAFIGFWVYLSRGLAHQLFRFTMVTLVLQAVCILVGSIGGIVGVAAGFATAAALEWPLSLVWLSRVTPIPVHALLGGAGRIICCSLPIGLAALVISHAMRSAPPAIAVVVSLGAAIALLASFAVVSRAVRADLAVVTDFGRRMVRR